MTIERVKELLEIAAGVNYFGTYYDIIFYNKSTSEVGMHASGDNYIVPIAELAEDADITFYRLEKIG